MDAKTWQLPPPENDTDFEVLCLDLFKAYKRPATEPQRWGRNGQAQHGIDFVIDLPEDLIGYQCKCTRVLTTANVEGEITKLAGFPLPLTAYVFLTTAAPDAAVQAHVVGQSRIRQREGGPSISILNWPAIVDLLAEYPAVLKAHYPDLAPQLLDLVTARARRLDREFPGSTFSVTATPSSVDVTLHPGPDGIPMTAKFAGPDVKGRFDEALRTGKPIAFHEGEVEVRVPDVLADLFGAAASTRMSMRPAVNGRTVRARILVQSATRHHNVDMFARRGRHSAEGIAATLTVVEAGTERMMIHVQGDMIPFKLTAEFHHTSGAQSMTSAFERPFIGKRPADALVAEEMLNMVAEGAYVGVFLENGDPIAFSTTPQPNEPSPLAALQLLADLAAAANWNIRVPNDLVAADSSVAMDFLHLFTHRSRLLGRGGIAHFNITTEAEMMHLRAFAWDASGPLNADIIENPRQISLFGQSFPVPAIRTRISHVELSTETKARLHQDVTFPFNLEIVMPPDSVIIEELV